MNDPIFILSYVLFFVGTALIVAVVMNLDSGKHSDKDHPAAGE